MEKYGSYESSAFEVFYTLSRCAPRKSPFVGKQSRIYYKCVGKHLKIVGNSVTGISGVKTDAAYVLSWDMRNYSHAKQFAVWNSTATLLHNNNSNYGLASDEALGKQIALEGKAYQFYIASISKDPSNVGLNPENTTNMDEVQVKVNQSVDEEGNSISGDLDGTYTIGPFSLNYDMSGRVSDNLTLAGISDMYLMAENCDGGEPERIEIYKFLVDGKYYDPEFFTPNTSGPDLYIDREKQAYPKSGEEFYIVYKADDEKIKSSIRVYTQFKWMIANASACYMPGAVYTIAHRDRVVGFHTHPLADGGSYTCPTYGNYTYLEKEENQGHLQLTYADRELYELTINLNPDDTDIKITMNLGGYVWEDIKTTKENIADGRFKVADPTTGEEVDIPLKNIKVTLYKFENGKASIVPIKDMRICEKSPDYDVMHSINPTFTDENGYYQFDGLYAMKKYYVTYEYNGQIYLPTEYLNTESKQYNTVKEMVQAGQYNTDDWKETSKGTEAKTSTLDGVEISRYGDSGYDKRFEEIGSYPNNYATPNTLGMVGGYNAVFTRMDLMGYTLGEDGKYSQTEQQLIDGYKYDADGLETKEFAEGVISTKIREYIEANKKFPDDNAMKNEIYASIAGSDKEMWRKLQFIEDCLIQSYTGSPFEDNKKDLYPVYEKFVIDDKEMSILEEEKLVKYPPIYPGQYYINLGLWRRQEFDVALRKDVYKATLKINDKTVVYNYDKRKVEDEGSNNGDGKDNNTYWDINVRMSDYDTYYGMNYNREIYDTDYKFNTQGENHPGDPLEIYITYKVTVRNQSMSILGQIKEVVDYYDKDYTYKPNLSWVIYQTDQDKTTTINKNEYYSMMEQQQEILDNESTSATDFIKNSKDAKVNENNSKYSGTEKNLGEQYQALYVRGLEDKKLATGESAYIYLTFEVNKDNSGRVILDDESSPKENIAEINGYKTYYKDGTELPNNVTKGSNDIAGLLDRDSNPGNLESKDIQGEKYEKNFEDDTDEAPALRVVIDNDAIRRANGTVWEDERTENVNDAMIGDGIRQDDEIGVDGVTVQLVEKGVDDSGQQYEYIWQETTTSNGGKYNFENYIPGDYVIRFYYGDTKLTALTKEDGGANVTSYNGQDFKSTLYQISTDGKGIEQQGTTDTSGRYQGYIYTNTQNVSGMANPKKRETEQISPENTTYGYDIYKADADTTNYSDAKDIWSTENRKNINIIGPVNSARLIQGRNAVIDYSDNDVTNHIAEVLASQYEIPNYNEKDYSDEEMNALYKELMDRTYMTAETGVIVVEFEYDRQQTDGLNSTANDKNNSSKDYIGDNVYNSNYTLNNIDFGLVERPKAQLEIDKSVANVKVTLANGSILFDINKAANNAIWKDHEEYSIDEKKQNNMYENYYDSKNNVNHRYAYRTIIDDIVEKTDRGLIQLTMDEELMHGATIQIEYTVKITNVGEIDYVDKDYKNFYYQGNTSDATVVTTTANQVVDYVQNNLQFANSAQGINNINTNKDNGWNTIKANNLTGENLVNDKLTGELAKFNTIIQTENFKTDALKPGDETSRTLILTQLITPENEEDDLTYSNMVEIVKTSNTVGRRMAYSVVGNQNPLSEEPSEVDSNVAEKIVILPPFGEVRMYYILGAIVAILLIGGIILIKKKVLKGKNE